MERRASIWKTRVEARSNTAAARRLLRPNRWIATAGRTATWRGRALARPCALGNAHFLACSYASIHRILRGQSNRENGSHRGVATRRVHCMCRPASWAWPFRSLVRRNERRHRTWPIGPVARVLSGSRHGYFLAAGTLRQASSWIRRDPPARRWSMGSSRESERRRRRPRPIAPVAGCVRHSRQEALLRVGCDL